MALLLSVAAGSASAIGCSDVGDSSAIPGPDGAADGTLESSIGPSDDSSTPGDDSTTGDDTSLPGTDTGTGLDTGMENETGADSEAQDSGGDSTTGEDAADSTVADTGSGMDSTVAMDSAADTSTVHDTGADTTEVDTGADTGPGVDSSTAEAGHDAQADSAADTGTDTGAGSLLPCTMAGQTNCVQCDGWSTGLCTPTEAAIVQRDIDKGYVTMAGPEPPDPHMVYTNDACYECLVQFGCLDDSTFNDTGHECEDPLSGGTSAECLTTLDCVLTTECAAAAVSTCYCGTAPVAGACQGNPAPGPINGACASKIAAGLGFAVTDGTDNTKNLTETTLASGIADQILQCAHSNNCKLCWQ